MERGRGWTRCVLWGGVALGVGTVLFALCSPSSVGCTTNLVVLTHSQVTIRGCAAYSVAAHLGVGLIVLGAVLLLGSFVLAVRQRRQAAGAASTVAAPAPVAEPSVESAPVAAEVPAAAEVVVEQPAPAAPVAAPRSPIPPPAQPPPAEQPPVEPPPEEQPPVERPPVERRRVERRARVRVGPIPPGEDDPGRTGPVSLPPGWYGNPDNPGGPVQWWDGTRLVDRPR